MPVLFHMALYPIPGMGDGGYICYSYHLSKTQGEDITWGVMINFDVVRLTQINRLLLQ